MTDEPHPETTRAIKQLWIAGLVGLCVLMLTQILVSVLLLGRLERARDGIRKLEARLATLESVSDSAERSPTTNAAPSRSADPETSDAEDTNARSVSSGPRTQPAGQVPKNPEPSRETIEALLAGDTESGHSRELKQAAEMLAAAIATPENPGLETGLLLARAWHQLGESDRARLWLERAGAIPPDRATDQLLLAEVLLATGGDELTAERALTHALKDPVVHDQAAKRLARIHLNRKDPEQAAALLASVSPVEDDPDYALLRGELAIQQGNYEEAIKQLAPLIERDGNSDAHVQIGVAKLRLAKADAALIHFIEAERADPTRPAPVFWQGVAQMRLHHDELAIRRFKHAIDLDSRYAPAWQYLGIALANKDRVEEAIDRLEQALRIEPENAEALFTLAVCHARKGHAEPALEALRGAIQLNASYRDKLAKVETFANVLTQEQINSLKQ